MRHAKDDMTKKEFFLYIAFMAIPPLIVCAILTFWQGPMESSEKGVYEPDPIVISEARHNGIVITTMMDPITGYTYTSLSIDGKHIGYMH